MLERFFIVIQFSTYAPGGHGCKPVGEWLLVRGSAPRNPALQGATAGLSIALTICGVFFGRMGDINLHGGIIFLAEYCFWGFVQQYALNGFFVNRLVVFLGGNKNPRAISMIAALVFSGLHFPNPFLEIATFFAGYFSARIFLEYRNLYFLGLVHGLIGFLLFFAFPEWITADFMVGMGFLER